MDQTNDNQAINVQLFYDSLREKVTSNNARLILNSALMQSGLKDRDDSLNSDEAKQLCLELINIGGPAFKIGQTIYRQYLQ